MTDKDDEDWFIAQRGETLKFYEIVIFIILPPLIMLLATYLVLRN